MRYALISDIHGNREALEAALDSIRAEKADSMFCLGDIVGYGADPNFCVETVRRTASLVIAGNHDHAAVGLTSLEYFNPDARIAALWTGQELTPENCAYLKELDFLARVDDILLVHSTPLRPEEWNYIFSPWEARWQFKAFAERICFIGHTHIPAEFREPDTERAIVNVGSVGQPRDFNPRGCYYLYDSETGEGEWVRVEYDMKAAADKIRRAGLPESLAERLKWGR